LTSSAAQPVEFRQSDVVVNGGVGKQCPIRLPSA
jgi:hypothetical protein